MVCYAEVLLGRKQKQNNKNKKKWEWTMRKDQNWKRFSFISSCFASTCVPNLAGASSFIIFFFLSFLSFLFLGSFSFKVSLLLLLRYQRSSKVAEIPREKRNEEKAPGVWLGIRRFWKKRRGVAIVFVCWVHRN